jgi:hypothetical protein
MKGVFMIKDIQVVEARYIKTEKDVTEIADVILFASETARRVGKKVLVVIELISEKPEPP